jgi:hypothetical protein
VLFALFKAFKKITDALGNELGKYLVENNSDLFQSFNIIKGFLNLVIADSYWINFLSKNHNDDFGKQAVSQEKDHGRVLLSEYQQAFASWSFKKYFFGMEHGRTIKSNRQ